MDKNHFGDISCQDGQRDIVRASLILAPGSQNSVRCPLGTPSNRNCLRHEQISSTYEMRAPQTGIARFWGVSKKRYFDESSNERHADHFRMSLNSPPPPKNFWVCRESVRNRNIPIFTFSNHPESRADLQLASQSILAKRPLLDPV